MLGVVLSALSVDVACKGGSPGLAASWRLLLQGVCGALWRAGQPTGLVSHAPLFICWSPSVSPSLLKCCFWALCVCEFIETPPMPLSVLVNDLLPLAVSTVHPTPSW